MKTRNSILPTILATAAAFIIPFSAANAALVTGWLDRNEEFGGTVSMNMTGANTASPTLTRVNTDSSTAIFAPISIPTLAQTGDIVTLSGGVTITGASGSNNQQFRIGIFDTAGSTNDNGWLGYWAGNGDGSDNGELRSRIDPNTSTFFAGGGTGLRSTSAAPGTAFNVAGPETYSFLMSIERTAGGLLLNANITRDDNVVFASHTDIPHGDPNTFSFDTVGFFSAAGYNPSEVDFSNIDATFIPEPSAALLGGLGLLALLFRRRR